MSAAHGVFRLGCYEIRLPEIMFHNAFIFRKKTDFIHRFLPALFGKRIVGQLRRTHHMNIVQFTIDVCSCFVTIHNRFLVQKLWKSLHNGFCYSSRTVQHIGNGTYTRFDTCQIFDDIAKILHRHHSLCIQDTYQRFQISTVSDCSFDSGRTFSCFLKAVTVAFHHLIFDCLFFDDNVNHITRVVYLQMDAVFPVGTVRAMLRIDSFNPIRMFECHMMSLMPLLSACFFTAFLSQTLWRRLFVTV